MTEYTIYEAAKITSIPMVAFMMAIEDGRLTTTPRYHPKTGKILHYVTSLELKKFKQLIMDADGKLRPFLPKRHDSRTLIDEDQLAMGERRRKIERILEARAVGISPDELM